MWYLDLWTLIDFDDLLLSNPIGNLFLSMIKENLIFSQSANFHAGSVVASYPYDDSDRHQRRGFYSAAPDDEFFKHIASIYSNNHGFMHEGRFCNGDDFPGGITNGAHWYDVPGGK